MACNIDHSTEDVRKKLASQKEYLPKDVYNKAETFLQKEQPQPQLNELFHLLKKYDLSSEEEQKERLGKMRELL
ncbi:MAG: group-specific protein [Alkalicoccus sp.]|nr:MAG: group-specific protein [Alkalicoccus sp.]